MTQIDVMEKTLQAQRPRLNFSTAVTLVSVRIDQLGYFADPENCRKYWHCGEGKHTHYTCPLGNLYDETTKICKADIYVNCGDRLICDDCDEDCQSQVLSFMKYKIRKVDFSSCFTFQ